jgi:hypothetical protein
MKTTPMRRTRLAITIAAVLAVLGVFLGIYFGSRQSAQPDLIPSKEFSAYVGMANPPGVGEVAKSLNHQITFALDGLGQRDWNGITDHVSVINRWKNTGYRMIWCVPMIPISGGASLAEGATGAYNGYYRILAQHLVAAGMGDSILRLGWEFNQSNFAWYAAGQPATFVAYWRQIVTTMRAVPGANFVFVWNPSRGDNGRKDLAMGNYADYYPGDQFVDIIGMDVYDTAWNHYPGEPAEFQTILTQTWGLDWLAKFAAEHKKPLAIPELGLGPFGPSAGDGKPFVGSGNIGGGDDPAFIDDMFTWIAHHNVAFVTYWDSQGSTIQNGNNPQTTQALRGVLASFGAKSGG